MNDLKNKNMNQYIISLDEGTSSCRAVLFNSDAEIVDIIQQEFTQYFPKPGWVEHDPIEIWEKQLSVMKQIIADNQIDAKNIAAIGITNQRETTVVWDKQTGKSIYNAIVWQDKRTTGVCNQLKKDQWEPVIRAKTGLVIDAYFSATKVQWILENVDGARDLAEKGDLLFGTIDTWLIWKLTNAKVHATDCSNASRTMLFNIETLEWDEELLEAFNVPESMLPEVKDSNAYFGDFEIDGVKIPITGVIGDQQAALFGQTAWNKGQAKNTYGTGCFLLLNTGAEKVQSQSGLLSTIAWKKDDQLIYALEGSVFIAGAAIQWLRDGLEIIESASETENLALSTSDDELVVVPAFSGLGAPYWDMNARGAIFGITQGSGKAELVKATLQSLALQSYDLLTAMQNDSGIKMQNLQVDGGAIANDFLAQFQADILDLTVERPMNLESTATGAAYMAALGVNLWSEEYIQSRRESEFVFNPKMSSEKRKHHLVSWSKAIERSRGWLE